MFCANCGNQMAEEAKFCQACGKGSGQVAVLPKPQHVAPVQTGAPGKNFLLVTGTLYIFFGAFDIIIGALALDVSDSFSSILSFFGVPNVTGPFRFLLFLFIISGAWNLIIGILGAKNSGVIENAYFLSVLAVIDLILSAVPLLFNFSWFALLFLAVPILYLIGALKNKGAQQYMRNVSQLAGSASIGGCASCGKSYGISMSCCPHCGHRPGSAK